jgi:hypothetical protein
MTMVSPSVFEIKTPGIAFLGAAQAEKPGIAKKIIKRTACEHGLQY